MHKTIFLSILFAVVGATCMFFMARYPGYVLVSAGDFAIEFNLWFFVTSLIVLFIAFFFSVRLFKYFWGGMKGSFLWFKLSKGRKVERRTQSGLLHFVEGNWQEAKKDMLAVAKDASNPMLNYLVAAKSAHQLGQIEEVQFLLTQAEKNSPEDKNRVVVSLAQMQFADKKYEQCLATLKRLKTKNTVALELLSQVLIKLGEWKELIVLLPELKNVRSVSDEEFNMLEENAYLSFLSAEANKKEEQDISGVWAQLPKNIKKNGKALGLYASILHRHAQDDVAETLIRKSLKSQWHNGLVELYGKLNVSNAKLQLDIAEAWLKQHQDDAHLNYALGKICVRNSLWGKAKSYFEESLKLKERPEVYAELGALMAQLGDNEKSSLLYKKGLALKIV